MSVAFHVNVKEHGPFFHEGFPQHEMKAMEDEIADEIGRVGVNMVHDRLHIVLKHPTGYYESQIRTDRTSDGVEVNDGGVIYGPWLEGTGSRNKTTRFKGYATFRKTLQALNERVEAIAEPVVAKYVARLN